MSVVLSSRSTSSVTSAQALPPAAFHPTRQDSLSTFSSSLMGHQDESSLLAPASPMQDFSQFGIQIHQSNGMDTNLTPTTDDDVLSTDYDFVFPAFHEGNDSAPAKIELFSPNAAFNLNTLNSSSSQQPVAAIAVAHSSGAAASASAASANADKPVLALLPDVLSRGSSIFNAPVPIMANVSNLSTESFHSPNSHMTPLSTSSSSVSPKSDDDSPQTELHTIKPDSDSNSKASTRRRRIPHIRPAAVPVPVAVAAPILASGAAPVAAIATVKVRKRREVQRYDEETRAKTRLENHRRYDKRRRQAMHMIFAELKQVIHTSADLSKKSKTFIPQSDMLAVNNAAMSVVSVDDEDDEDSKKILKDLPNMTELENYSQHQLFSAAAASIRMLNGIREQLEKQIDNTESESAALDKKAKEDSMEAESTAVARAISAPVSDINTLLQAIAVVNRRYQLEVDAVRTIQSQLPLFINSLADYFPEFAVLGIDASVTSSVNFKFDGEFRDGYILARKCRAHDGIRVPFLAQVHQLCAYITKRFRYQDIAMVDVHSIDLRNYQSAEQVLQLFKESRDAPDTYLTDGKPTPNTIVHSQFLYPPAPSPLTAANLAASSPASSSAASASASGTVTPLILPEAQNHPLGQYAVDPESFRAIQDMLAFFVSLGPEQFDAKIFALVGASRDHFRVPEPSPTAQSMALSVDSHEWLPKALVHHPLFSPTYDQVQALHELYTGKKPVVRYRGQIMPSPGENALYMDSDMTLICHPSTGLPMAHLCLPRNMYYSKEKYKDIERRAFQRAGISEHESFFK